MVTCVTPGRDLTDNSTGYKLSAAKSMDEYAKLDEEDESLSRWKASLGIGPGAAGSRIGPPVTMTCGRGLDGNLRVVATR